MEVLTPQNQSSDDWHQPSLDESWDSRLPTPLHLDLSMSEEEFTSYTNGDSEDLYINNGYKDSPATPDSHNEFVKSNDLRGESDTEYLQMARKGGGHTDLLKIEAHTPTPEPVNYNKKDGQWYAHNGVDVKDTQQRKEMMTISSQPSTFDNSVDVETDTDYLKIAKKGGGHKDLLVISAHTPSPEPVKCDKKEGQWYSHDGVDVNDTLQRKEMMTVSSQPSTLDTSVDIETDTDYLKIAKKGGGHKDLLTVTPHTPTPEPVTYDKTDGQWYTHDGVDVKETQQRNTFSLDFNGSLDNDENIPVAAGGRPTEYLDLAKKGGGHKDLLTVMDHSPSPEPQKYKKIGGEWYNQDDMVIRDGPQDTGNIKKRRRTYSDSAAESKAETEYLRTARRGGGHKDLLILEAHVSSPEPVKVDKKDGQWYTHDGVDVKETQGRKEMVTLPNSPRPSSTASSVIDIETDTDYLKIAKKGGGHKDLLTVEAHTPTPKPATYNKTDGQWYTHDGVDVKETQSRRDVSASIDSCQYDNDVVAAGQNGGEYLELAKKGGGHKDLLMIEPHIPTPEPVTFDRKDGQWYSHDGVDIRDTQQRKEMVTVASTSPSPSNLDSSLEIETDTDYLKIAKKGGGHKDLLTVEPHTPTLEPVKYDKTDGQWYTHDGVDVKETQQRKELAISINDQRSISEVAAGANNTNYLDLAKKGGGHRDLLTIAPHTPTPEPVKYDKTDGQWYSHDGVDVNETQQRRDMSCTLESIPEDLAAAGENNGEYLQVAKKGGRKDLLTVEPHTPTPEPVMYDKKDGQWYAHDGVDVKETQSRKEMVTVASSPCPSSAVDVNTDTEYLKIAKKGGGHKDLLTVEPHTPTPEPVKYDKTDGQWYSHDGVDVKETQSRREMVTVCMSPRSPSAASSVDTPTETDYLKMAKKGGGHKDLLVVESHTPKQEPVKYEKKDGQWYSHDGVDVKETQQRKDLLTIEPHTPSPEPKKYQKHGGDWFTQDVKETKGSPVQPHPRKSNSSSDTDYLKIARKGGGHSELLTVTPHTPSPEPVKYDKKDGQWYSHDGVDVNDTQQRKGLLSMEAHTPSPEPKRYEKKGGEWYTQDSIDGERPKGKKGSPSSSIPHQINTDTEYLRTARKGGGHKDLLTIEQHKPSPKPKKQERKLGDWYYHDESVVKDSRTPSSSPKKSTSDAAKDSDYLRMARKGRGHKDLLMMTPQTASPRPREAQRNGDATPVSSSRNGTSSDSTDYLRLARKGGGHPDLLSSAPYQSSSSGVDTSSAADALRRKDPIIQDSPLRRSASMRYPSRSTASDYLSIARKGGHHKDLLTMPEDETSNFKRDQASRRSLRSFRSPLITQVDGPSRPKTADSRQSQPIWLGGSGPERVHSPGKRFINQGSVVAPFASHVGSPGAAKNPDKI